MLYCRVKGMTVSRTAPSTPVANRKLHSPVHAICDSTPSPFMLTPPSPPAFDAARDSGNLSFAYDRTRMERDLECIHDLKTILALIN